MYIFLGNKNNKRDLNKLLFLLLLSCFVLLAIQIIPVLLDPPERRVGGVDTTAITANKQSLAQKLKGEK